MSKEELINRIEQFSGMGNVSVTTVKKLLNEFFESNVCIPKGETLQAKVSGHWFDVCTAFPSVEYRIKERVVYEWQYCLTAPNCGCTYTKHMTDEEVKHYDMGYYKSMDKVEDTKRERK